MLFDQPFSFIVAIEKKTSQEVWSGSPTTYSDLKIFRCLVYAHVDNGKLEPKSVKCIFLGYKYGVKGYKLWCPETKKSIISKDVIFYGTSMIQVLASKDSSIEIVQIVDKQVEFETGLVPNSPSTSVPVQQYYIIRDRERRAIKPPQKYGKADLIVYASSVVDNIEFSEEPSTYEEVVSCNDSGKWMIVMQEEMETLHKNGTWDMGHGTWDMVRLPKRKKAIWCKWVFKKKEGTPGVENARYKVRLVAKGYSQIPSVDFTNVFSLVVKHSSIIALLGIVAFHDYELEQLNVKTAFLLGELEDEIYMLQPEGFIVSGKEDCLPT